MKIEVEYMAKKTIEPYFPEIDEPDSGNCLAANMQSVICPGCCTKCIFNKDNYRLLRHLNKGDNEWLLK